MIQRYVLAWEKCVNFSIELCQKVQLVLEDSWLNMGLRRGRNFLGLNSYGFGNIALLRGLKRSCSGVKAMQILRWERKVLGVIVRRKGWMANGHCHFFSLLVSPFCQRRGGSSAFDKILLFLPNIYTGIS